MNIKNIIRAILLTVYVIPSVYAMMQNPPHHYIQLPIWCAAINDAATLKQYLDFLEQNPTLYFDINDVYTVTTPDYFVKDKNIKLSMTILHCAALNGSQEVIKLLLGANANIECQEPDFHRRALHFACYCADNLGCLMLIEKNADINAESRCGTPLQIACTMGNFMTASCLLFCGAKIEAQNGTALHDACKGGNWDIVYLLLSYDAQIDVTNNEGQTPLMLAEQNGHEAIVALLQACSLYQDRAVFLECGKALGALFMPS